VYVVFYRNLVSTNLIPNTVNYMMPLKSIMRTPIDANDYW